jgi:hypothetical protein
LTGHRLNGVTGDDTDADTRADSAEAIADSGQAAADIAG